MPLDIAASTADLLRIKNTGAGPAAMIIDAPTGDLAKTIYRVNGVDKASSGFDGSSDSFKISRDGGLGGSDFVIDPSGNVGIGTTSPEGKLDVRGEMVFGEAVWHTTTGGEQRFNFQNGGETIIRGHGGTPLKFRSGGDADRMVILDGGNVGIGVTNPGQKLDVNGNVRAAAFLYTSDENLKENIKPIDSALEKITALEGVSFDWKDSGESSVGVVAQNVEEVFPELVSTNEDTGLKSVHYGNLVAPLIEAVKELKAENEALRAEIDALK